MLKLTAQEANTTTKLFNNNTDCANEASEAKTNTKTLTGASLRLKEMDFTTLCDSMLNRVSRKGSAKRRQDTFEDESDPLDYPEIIPLDSASGTESDKGDSETALTVTEDKESFGAVPDKPLPKRRKAPTNLLEFIQ